MGQRRAGIRRHSGADGVGGVAPTETAPDPVPVVLGPCSDGVTTPSEEPRDRCFSCVILRLPDTALCLTAPTSTAGQDKRGRDLCSPKGVGSCPATLSPVDTRQVQDVARAPVGKTGVRRRVAGLGSGSNSFHAPCGGSRPGPRRCSAP